MRGIRYLFSPDYKNIEIKKCSSSLHSTKAHLHDELSVVLVEKGNFVIELFGRSYIQNEKSILVIPAKVVHKCIPVDLNNWNIRMIYIDTTWIEKIFDIPSTEVKFMYKELDNISYNKIRRIFSVIESFDKSVKSESEMLELISSILFFPREKYKEISNTIQQIKVLNIIKEFIEVNYLKDLMLQDFVNVSGLSKYYIIRQFEKKYGTSPHQYLTSLRINHARKIMRRSKNISGIAVETGFYDQAHFTKTFKEYTGITPKAYLKNIE